MNAIQSSVGNRCRYKLISNKVCLAYYYIHGVDEDDADVAGVSEDTESDAEGASAVEGA